MTRSNFDPERWIGGAIVLLAFFMTLMFFRNPTSWLYYLWAVLILLVYFVWSYKDALFGGDD